MTTIHTGNTTTTGFTVDSDNSGDLILKTGGSGGTTAATFSGATQQATFAAPVSQPGGFSFRNKIINGDMRIDQRNSGASQTITAAAALAYTVDRWYAYCTGANVTGQRVAGSNDSEYRYRFTGAASVTKIGFAQRIESTNSYDLNGSTVTLSVDLANSLLSEVTWTAWYANTADTFGTLASPTRTQISTGTFTVTSNVTRYSTQITIPLAATTGIEIEFSVGAQTSGTWTIGNVQLEKGSAATPFEQRPYGLELSLCQRYYETVSLTSGYWYSVRNESGVCRLVLPWQVVKRASPTVTLSFNVGSGAFSTLASALGASIYNADCGASTSCSFSRYTCSSEL